MSVVLIISLLALALLGVPIGFAIGISCLAALLFHGSLPLIAIPQKIFSGIDSFPILAIPFFILAGDLMSQGGLNKKIIDFANSIVGWITGSLAMVTVVASMFFAAISGSAVATVSAVGGVTIPAMKADKYKPSLAAAIASSAAVCGPIIPPSIPLIVYGAALGLSISDLFLGAVFPGIVLGLVLCAMSYILAKKTGARKGREFSVKTVAKTSKDGFWALIMPVIILGGIFGGIFTPTEASVVAVIFSLLVGLFIYKNLKLRNLYSIFANSLVSTSVIMIILATSKISSWIVVADHLPQALTSSVLGMAAGKIGIFILINCILLVIGCLMEANAAIVILTPVLVPLMTKLGMSPLQFGIVMTFNLSLGLLTPPVGATILIGNDLAGEKMEKTILSTIPFFLVGLIVLGFIIFVPEFTTFLPSVLGN